MTDQRTALEIAVAAIIEEAGSNGASAEQVKKMIELLKARYAAADAENPTTDLEIASS